MRCFQKARKYYGVIGFSPNLKPFNFYHLSGIFLSTTGIISNLLYLRNVASSAKEYADSLYMTVVTISFTLCYLNVILKKTAMFDYFNEVEENFNSSKSVLKVYIFQTRSFSNKEFK